MTITETALLISSVATPITALVSAVLSYKNGRNIQRIETNTNSISKRNEDIAKQLGITEGVAQEKAKNP